MNLQQRFSDVRCLVVVVSTPLQYFNALELAEQLNPQLRCLVISYPAGTHEKFLGLPAIDRWQHVEMVQTELGKGEPPLKMRWIGPLWRFYKELRNDLRALRKLRGFVGEFANPEVVVIGRAGDLAHDFMAMNLCGESTILVDDGATSVANLGGPTAVVLGKKRAIRRRLYLPAGKHPAIDGVFTAYEVPSSSQLPVYQNSYPYMRALRRHSSSICAGSKKETVWMLGQPLCQYGLYSQDEYCERISSIRDKYPHSTEFFYLPHPTETEVEVDSIRTQVGVQVIESSLPVEALLLGDQKVETPSRIATFYSGAYRSLSLIFGPELPMDIFQMKSDYWRGPTNLHEQINRIYASLESIVRDVDRYYREVGTAQWLESK